MPRILAPEKDDTTVRQRLMEFAKENGLIVNEHLIHKLVWSEKHGGRCFCDWMNRPYCPCPDVFKDLEEFNGGCLCNLLMTPERYERYIKLKNNPPKKQTEDDPIKRAIRTERRLKAEKIIKKMFRR